MSLQDLLTDLESRRRRYRSLSNLIQSSHFAAIWANLPQSKKSAIQKLILDGAHRRKITDILYDPDIPVEYMSVRQWRALGQKLCILNYSRLSKSELTKKILAVLKEGKNPIIESISCSDRHFGGIQLGKSD